MNDVHHDTEIVVRPFPLLTNKLKELKQQYQDALWNNDLDKGFQIKLKIDAITKAIELGEKYDIPF